MTKEKILSDCRRIDSGLPAEWGPTFLRSIEGQLSDGMWENSSRAEGYWRFFCIVQEEGKTYICISNEWSVYPYGYTRPVCNKFKFKSDAWVLNWFAEKAYQLGLDESKSEYRSEGFAAKQGNQVESIYFHRISETKPITGHIIWLGRHMLKGRAQIA